MAVVLPRFVALKSHYNQKYMVLLEFSDPTMALQLSGENMNSPDAMFQVEISHQNNKMVNIKCCRNNKYLRRRSDSLWDWWIHAQAKNADENTSSWTSTNFEVFPVGDGNTNTFRFRHAQLGHYLCPHETHQAMLWAEDPKISNPNGPIFDFTVIDLEPLFALPRFVAFKSSFNQKHLQPVDPPQQQSTFVISSEDLAITPYTKFQVMESNQVKGMVHIRCCQNNKYLCRQSINKSSEFWIVADADEPEEDVYNWMCTLFRPVQVNAEAKTFRLRHPRLANYVRISVHAAAVNANRQFCLNAYSAQPAKGHEILADLFTATVWEEPTMALPRFVTFKSSHNQKYLQHYDDFEGSLIRGSAEEITSPYTKYEVEASKKVEEMVHIRCYHTKRYWRRRTQNDSWLVAEAHIPDEELSNWTCTLFKPVQVDATAKTFRLRHVQLQHYARLFENVANTNLYLCLYAQQKDPAQQSLVDVFTAIDWESIPKPKPKPDPPSVLPKYAAFKGDNGKYLSATMIQGNPHLQFNSNNKEDPLCRNEVIVYPDDTIRIRNVYYNKYWKPQNDWIFVHGEIPPKPCSLFHLIRISGNVIALRSDQNKRICIRSVEGQKENCLYSGADTLTKEAHLKVKELNLEPL